MLNHFREMNLTRQNILIFLVGGLLILSSIYVAASNDTKASVSIDNSTVKLGGLMFMTNMTDALERSQLENKMIYIYGRSEFCGWCKKFEAESLSDERIKRILNENFILVRVDTVDQKSLALSLGIRGTPTSIFTTSEGQEIPGSRLPGYSDQDSFYQHLNGLIDKEE
ncbi:MAG: DUF255 domain-containing protein [ANME-2 cluster archaeon]|nr:MAG: DUF255 domain-containing protein [ANME-2 cluster archaeon]